MKALMLFGGWALFMALFFIPLYRLSKARDKFHATYGKEAQYWRNEVVRIQEQQLSLTMQRSKSHENDQARYQQAVQGR